MSQQEPKQRQGRRLRERLRNISFTKYTLVMSILFLIIVVPILLGIVGLGRAGLKFSIYSDSWDGLSSLNEALQSEGYTNVTNGMSSLSILNRIYDPGVLVIMGPATQYSTTDTTVSYTHLTLPTN